MSYSISTYYNAHYSFISRHMTWWCTISVQIEIWFILHNIIQFVDLLCAILLHISTYFFVLHYIVSYVKIWFMLHHSLPYVGICAIWLHMLICNFNLHNSLSYDLIIRSNVSYVDMTYMSSYDFIMSTIVSYAHMRFKLQIIIPYADTWFLHTL